ncbi:MAG: hypothetical protein AAF235_10790, partial [Planctomycetota bacterium]
ELAVDGVPMIVGACDARVTSDVGDTGLTGSVALAAGERGDRVEALWAWAASLGLRPVGVLPARAAERVHAIRLATAADADPLTPVCVVGMGRTTLAAGAGGDLRFARSIDVGIASLIRAYEQSLAAAAFAGVDLGAAVAQDDEESDALHRLATRLFRDFGIPRRDDALVGDTFTGVDALPLLQRVIQRLTIELRQTIQFGSDGDAIDPRGIFLSFPCGVPRRLAELIGGYLELDVTLESGSRIANRPMGALLTDPVPDGLLLKPIGLRRRRAEGRLRGAVLTGTAFAAGVLLLDGVAARSSLRDAEIARSALSAEVDVLRMRGAAAERLAAMSDRLDSCADAAATAVTEPRWEAALVAVARALRATVRIESLTGTAGDASGGMIGNTLSGTENADRLQVSAVVEADDEYAARDSINAVVASLERSDAVRSLALTSRERTDPGDSGADWRFTMELVVRRSVDAPPELLAAVETGAGLDSPGVSGEGAVR